MIDSESLCYLAIMAQQLPATYCAPSLHAVSLWFSFYLHAVSFPVLFIGFLLSQEGNLDAFQNFFFHLLSVCSL